MSVVPTNHEHIQHLLPDLVTEKLQAQERRELESHLSSCEECRSRLEGFQSLNISLNSFKPSDPPAHYFSTVVPRMREKIEGRAKTVEHRFVRRVLVPLGALAVILAVLSRIPLNAEKDLRSVLNSMKSDELAEIAVEDAERQSLYLVPSTESLAASLAEQTIDTKLAAAILSDDGATFDSMSDLSDQDVTVILKRLGERKIL
jgi:anti-sigma factor RsiW